MTSQKKKIIIVSSSFPYGLKETFLYNEVIYLSEYFDLEIFPILKNTKFDKPVSIPSNISFHEPIVPRNYFLRVFRGLFNLSPIMPHIKDLFLILRKPDHFLEKITRWLMSMLLFRTVYSSHEFKEILRKTSTVVYFYWGGQPIQLLQKLNKSIFIRIHGNEADIRRNHGYIPLLRYIAVNKTNIQYLPISHNAAELLLNLGNVRYTINRLGVFDKGINPPTCANEHLRIVSCSNLIKLKRVHLIVRALSQLEVPVEWVHFGDGPLYTTLSEEIKLLNKNVTVHFMGRVQNSKVLEFYSENHIDLFVNTSEIEGVPVSVMEAFSFGIPCFATNVGGTKEIVDSSNGYLAERDFNISELSEFIKEIRNLSSKNNLRQNARETWSRLCNATSNYHQLAVILDKIANPQSPESACNYA